MTLGACSAVYYHAHCAYDCASCVCVYVCVCSRTRASRTHQASLSCVTQEPERERRALSTSGPVAGALSESRKRKPENPKWKRNDGRHTNTKQKLGDEKERKEQNLATGRRLGKSHEAKRTLRKGEIVSTEPCSRDYTPGNLQKPREDRRIHSTMQRC